MVERSLECIIFHPWCASFDAAAAISFSNNSSLGSDVTLDLGANGGNVEAGRTRRKEQQTLDG